MSWAWVLLAGVVVGVALIMAVLAYIKQTGG